MMKNPNVDENSTDIPFLKNIGFMMTYRCSIACPHCIVEAGPHRTEEMRLEDCCDWLEQARAYRDGHIEGLAITGGEPFYALANLRGVVRAGTQLGFTVSAVTNAFWAHSKENAIQTLSCLPGISMISVSTDEYHQKAIPFDNIRNAVWAAQELGILFTIAVCTDSEENVRYKSIISNLREIAGDERIRISITFPVGRAAKRLDSFAYQHASEPPVGACTMGSSPVVFPDGQVKACIGPVITLRPNHPLALGNLRQEPLAAILDRAEIDPLLHAIRIWGPHTLVSMLRENGRGAGLPRDYLADCICDTCYKLFQDETTVRALKAVAKDEEFVEKIAYGRLYYLHETRMLEMLGRAGASGGT